MIQNRTILVTGSSGFIGSHLVNRIKHCNEVILCDKDIGIDLKDLQSVQNLPDVDYVFHLAAYNGTKFFYEKPLEVLEDSTIPTLNLIRRYGGKVEKFIYASTCEIYSDTVERDLTLIPTDENVGVFFEDPSNLRWTYAASKYHGELAVRAAFKKFNQIFQIHRFNNIYGPNQKDHFIPEFVDRAKMGDISLYGWSNTRSFCYIDDAIEAVIELSLCKEADNQVIHIGSGIENTIKEVADIILEIMGINKEIELKDAPEGSVSRRCPNIKKLKSMIQFEPKVSIEEGLRLTLQELL